MWPSLASSGLDRLFVLQKAPASFSLFPESRRELLRLVQGPAGPWRQGPKWVLGGAYLGAAPLPRRAPLLPPPQDRGHFQTEASPSSPKVPGPEARLW